MTEQFESIERVVQNARRMKLRSDFQRTTVHGLIYHIDMLAATVRNQRRQLSDLNRKIIPPNVDEYEKRI